MEIHEIKDSLRCAENTARELLNAMDGLEHKCEQWEQMENEGYDEASDVIDLIQAAVEWTDLGENTGLSPYEVSEKLDELDELEAGVEQLRLATEITMHDGDTAEEIIDALRGQSSKGAGEVITAIQMLIGALHRAGALGGTEAVPTIVTMEPPSPADGSDDNADSGTDTE
jgi:hypothetical protein